MKDDILSYREMCEAEGEQTLQRGMNFRLNPEYSVILMSRRPGAPYRDRVLADGITIQYEGHDQPKQEASAAPKTIDQLRVTTKGTLTQNGRFAKSVDDFKAEKRPPEPVKVYEKILPGVWSLKGMFHLVDYRMEQVGQRNVFVFELKLCDETVRRTDMRTEIQHSRLIPSEVKKDVWRRDKGRCVLCGSGKNLHFDHELPFSKGGTSLLVQNIRLLCAQCNLAKSNRIE